MGLIVRVLRTPGFDCTSDGVSATHDNLCVLNIDGPFVPSDRAPAVILIDGPRGSKHLAPAVPDPDVEGGWKTKPGARMAGGNYATSSDGRFTATVGFYGAVAIHDRYE